MAQVEGRAETTMPDPETLDELKARAWDAWQELKIAREAAFNKQQPRLRQANEAREEAIRTAEKAVRAAEKAVRTAAEAYRAEMGAMSADFDKDVTASDKRYEEALRAVNAAG